MTNEELVGLIQGGARDRLTELWTQVEKFVAVQAHKRLVLSAGLGGVECGDLDTSAGEDGDGTVGEFQADPAGTAERYSTAAVLPGADGNNQIAAKLSMSALRTVPSNIILR